MVDSNNKTPLILKLYYLYYIKKSDAWNNYSFGTNLKSDAIFKTPPILRHGPNGIIIGHDVSVGENCEIYQQVTVIHGGLTKIGDNVIIGAGAKVLGGVIIGDNCKIGANCVVVENLPAGATCVMQKPRIILKNIEL